MHYAYDVVYVSRFRCYHTELSRSSYYNRTRRPVVAPHSVSMPIIAEVPREAKNKPKLMIMFKQAARAFAPRALPGRLQIVPCVVSIVLTYVNQESGGHIYGHQRGGY